MTADVPGLLLTREDLEGGKPRRRRRKKPQLEGAQRLERSQAPVAWAPSYETRSEALPRPNQPPKAPRTEEGHVPASVRHRQARRAISRDLDKLRNQIGTNKGLLAKRPRSWKPQPRRNVYSIQSPTGHTYVVVPMDTEGYEQSESVIPVSYLSDSPYHNTRRPREPWKATKADDGANEDVVYGQKHKEPIKMPRRTPPAGMGMVSDSYRVGPYYYADDQAVMVTDIRI